MNNPVTNWISVIAFIVIVVAFFSWIVWQAEQNRKEYKEWCNNNYQECYDKWKKQDDYLKEQQRKEQESEFSCGLTTPGWDTGWGGFKCGLN